MQQLLDVDPRTIGHWKLLGRLSTSGGMSIVYLAEGPGTLAAVKVILAEHVLDDEYRRRFRIESESLATVASPYVIRLLDSDADAPKPWIAMEYSDAKDLAVTVNRTGPLTRRNGLVFLERLAQGLADLHAVDIIHRDIKPANVLATDSGPLIIDLGIAKVPQGAGTTRFSPATAAWASPEQLSDNPVITSATDVFNLGMVSAYTLTGQHPFGPCGNLQEEAAMIVRMAQGRPVDLPIEPDLRALVYSCFVAPEARPSALEFSESLAQLQRQDRVRGSDGQPSVGNVSEPHLGASAPDLSGVQPRSHRPAAAGAKPDAWRLPERHADLFVLVPLKLASDLETVTELLHDLAREEGFEIEEDGDFVTWSGADRRFAISRSQDHSLAGGSNVWEQLRRQPLAAYRAPNERLSRDVGGRLFLNEPAARTYAALNSATDPKCVHVVGLESFSERAPGSVTAARRRFPNHGRTWTKSQERKLIDLLLQGAPLRQMVKESGRSPAALCSRLQDAGLLGTLNRPAAVDNAFTISFDKR